MTLPAELEIRRVDRSQDPILRNLFELYCHDMAEWFGFDSNEDGGYAYATEKIWDGGYDVHLAYAAKIPIGFALVGSAESYNGDPAAKDLKDFFVNRRHRRSGLGRTLARHVWDQYRGPWLVRVFQGNLPAAKFWPVAIDEYTGHRFREDVQRRDDRDWTYYEFDTTADDLG